MSDKIRVIQCGLGLRGSEIVRLMLDRKNIQVVGAVEVSDKLVGKDLGRVVGLNKDLGIQVSDNVENICESLEADVFIDATVNELDLIYEIIEPALSTGKNVISFGGEGTYPWLKFPDLARRIDDLAKQNKVTFLSAGILPGFIFDYLPILMTALMGKVTKIEMHRISDMSGAGPINWRGYGCGKTLEEYNLALSRKEIQNGHMGFEETFGMLSKALGWGKLEGFTENVEPFISRSRREAVSGVVEPGTVCGVNHRAIGFVRGTEVISAYLTVVVRPEVDGLHPGTSILLKGNPDIEIKVSGFQAGMATSNIAVNLIPTVINARSGMLDVYELPPSPCYI